MNERLGQLVERLHSRTEHREIQWQKSSPDTFETSFPNYTVEVGQFSGFPEPTTYLKIYNEEGEVLEMVQDPELRTGDFVAGYDDRYQVKLREIYQMARRIALGTDEAIDSLISALDD
jgi:hypothetical protein